MARRKKGFFYFFFIILAAVILTLGGVFIYRYTDGFSVPPQMFYVKYDGKMILYEGKQEIKKGKDYVFNCYDTLLFFSSKQCNGYTVYVRSSDRNTFNYTVDGFSKSFKSLGDISSAFTLIKNDDSFTLKVDKDMQGIIQSLYEDNQEVLLPNIDFTLEYYFTLVIGNKSGSSFVYIDFKIT